MLNQEVKSLKYALTCRIELKNNRASASISAKKCNCEEKMIEFENHQKVYEQSILQLEQKIEELNDERTSLFDLISKLATASDSGNE